MKKGITIQELKSFTLLTSDKELQDVFD